MRTVRCPEVDGETFDRFYREVLETSFPPSQLYDLPVLRDMFLDPDSGALGYLVMRGDRPVAGALAKRCTTADVVLLTYLAVHPDARGQGIGGALLQEGTPRWSAAASLVLGEVEDPRIHSRNQYADPAARLRFYQRTGARYLRTPYFQPSMRPGQPRVPGMLLLGMASRSSAGADAATVVAFLDEYFTSCEGPEAVATDPAYLDLRRAVATVPEGVIRLDDLSRIVDPPAMD